MANKVVLTFDTDERDSVRAFDNVGDAADDMARDVGTASKRMGDSTTAGFDRVGSGADDVDTKAMGFRDTLTGLQDTASGTGKIMEGELFEGFLTLGAGIGDLGSGVANLIAPMAKTVSAWVSGHATMAASSVASVATQVKAWAVLGVQSLINAAKVAAAWLISVGPLILVGLAVVALVFLIVKNWDTIKRVVSAGARFIVAKTTDAWNAIVSFVTGAASKYVGLVRSSADAVIRLFSSLPGRVGGALSTLASAITAPFRRGFAGIKAAWNSTVGGKGFSVPGWVPGIGGRSFRIPRLHQGGIFRAPNGREGLALLRDNEEVITPEQRRRQNGPVFIINMVVQGTVQAERDLMALMNENLQRSGAIPGRSA